MKKIKTYIPPVFLLTVALILNYEMIPAISLLNKNWEFVLFKISKIALIGCIAWFLIIFIRITKQAYFKKLNIDTTDNLARRKIYTQFELLEKIAVFVIIIVAVASALLLFDSVKKIGLSIFASAGIAGLVLGFAAQKVIGAILAGLQIALTQPIRQDDEVLVENEWGKVEEIYLTFVVIRIWDKRRLILPSTYFIEKPFQNWTRTSSEIIGTVFIYVDYSFPVEILRNEVTNILKNSLLWDGKINVVQVTNTTSDSVEIRILVGALNSSDAWDLRVLVREKVIQFIQENYPECLPKRRLNFNNGELIP